jgi:hypothetical protein
METLCVQCGPEVNFYIGLEFSQRWLHSVFWDSSLKEYTYVSACYLLLLPEFSADQRALYRRR